MEGKWKYSEYDNKAYQDEINFNRERNLFDEFIRSRRGEGSSSNPYPQVREEIDPEKDSSEKKSDE